MSKNRALIGGLIGGAGVALLGLFKISVSIDSQEIIGLLDIVTQYFLVLAYIVLLYLYYILHEQHRECRKDFAVVSSELHELKNRLINLEHARKD